MYKETIAGGKLSLPRQASGIPGSSNNRYPLSLATSRRQAHLFEDSGKKHIFQLATLSQYS